MEQHTQLRDLEFANKFEDLSLNPSWFTHEAHLRLAWILIERHGVNGAIHRLRTQIQAFDNTHGEGTKYNETVTVAAVYILKHFMNQAQSKDFFDLIEEFPRIKYRFKDLVFTHYSFNIFTDGEAKFQYLEPDLLPFS